MAFFTKMLLDFGFVYYKLTFDTYNINNIEFIYLLFIFPVMVSITNAFVKVISYYLFFLDMTRAGGW